MTLIFELFADLHQKQTRLCSGSHHMDSKSHPKTIDHVQSTDVGSRGTKNKCDAESRTLPFCLINQNFNFFLRPWPVHHTL